MKNKIKEIFAESILVKQETLNQNEDKILKAVSQITRALKAGNKIILFGNGGSAADSQHIAAELVGRFQKERNPFLPTLRESPPSLRRTTAVRPPLEANVRRTMGDASRANVKKFLDANKKIISDPDRLVPGVMVKVPDPA